MAGALLAARVRAPIGVEISPNDPFESGFGKIVDCIVVCRDTPANARQASFCRVEN
jgi:hypothetical protein